MGIFLIYYLVSTGYMLLVVFRYKEYLKEHPVTQNIGFELLAALQLISGFLIAPYCLYYDIKVTYSNRRYKKRWIKETKERRIRFIIETTISDDQIFTSHLDELEQSLGSYIDDTLYTMELCGDKFDRDQYLISKDGRIGWLENGDPENLLDQGWNKIVTIKTVLQIVAP